jgi:chorismate dehydratase
MDGLISRCQEPTVSNEPAASRLPPIRIGAVTYLNTRPLVWCLPELLPAAKVIVDLPSRLADGLARGQLDVATIPSIEYFRAPGATIVSNACVACDGKVKSVKLYSRVPLRRIRTLALDEGSRTSAAMTRIMLKERYNLEPDLVRLPIGSSVDDVAADAAMLIGDRAIRASDNGFDTVCDLGEEWSRWTGLPFVFSMWIARPHANLQDMDRLLAAARDEGVRRLEEIARAESPALGIPEAECLSYLRDNLVFELGPRQRLGLETFYQLAVQHGLAPPGIDLVFYDHRSG